MTAAGIAIVAAPRAARHPGLEHEIAFDDDDGTALRSRVVTLFSGLQAISSASCWWSR